MQTVVYYKEDYCDKREFKTIGLVDVNLGIFLAWQIGRSIKSQKVDFEKIRVGDIVDNIFTTVNNDAIDYAKSEINIQQGNGFERLEPLLETRLRDNQKQIKDLIIKLNEKKFEHLLDKPFLSLKSSLRTYNESLPWAYVELMMSLNSHFKAVENILNLSLIIQGREKLGTTFKSILFSGIQSCLREVS